MKPEFSTQTFAENFCKTNFGSCKQSKNIYHVLNIKTSLNITKYGPRVLDNY